MKYQYYDKLEKYVADGLVEVNKHPTEDLYIYNYSRKTQYESLNKRIDESSAQMNKFMKDQVTKI